MVILVTEPIIEAIAPKLCAYSLFSLIFLLVIGLLNLGSEVGISGFTIPAKPAGLPSNFPIGALGYLYWNSITLFCSVSAFSSALILILSSLLIARLNSFLKDAICASSSANEPVGITGFNLTSPLLRLSFKSCPASDISFLIVPALSVKVIALSSISFTSSPTSEVKIFWNLIIFSRLSSVASSSSLTPLV